MHPTDTTYGLRQQQADELLKSGLGNRLSARKRTGFFSKLLSNLSDPILKILLAALCVNLLFLFRGEGWFETAGIALAILTASLISTLSEYSSEAAFARLNAEEANRRCRVLRAEGLVELPAAELVVGDTVCIGAGEGVPADGRILRGRLGVDQSAMTGESRVKCTAIALLPSVLIKHSGFIPPY